MPSPLAACHKITGHWPSAILLYRIRYWFPKATLTRDGKTWIAKSRQDWSEETGLTLKEIDGALSRLKTRRLISTRQGVFGNKAVLHLTVSPQEEAQVSFQEETQVLPEEGTLIQGDTAESYSTEKITGPVPGSGSEDPEMKKTTISKGQAILAEKKGKSIADLLAAAPAKPKAPEAKGTLQSVSLTWVHFMREVYGQKELSLKALETKMLMSFLKATPMQHREKIVEVLITKWGFFAEHAKSALGWKTVPSQPSIPFVVKHSNLAVDYAMKQISPQSQPLPVKAAKPLPEPKAVQSIAQKSEEKPASYDELLSVLNGEG